MKRRKQRTSQFNSIKKIKEKFHRCNNQEFTTSQIHQKRRVGANWLAFSEKPVPDDF